MNQPFSRRALALLTATLICLALLAASAGADTTSVKDEVRESAPLRKNGRLDITKAVAGHKGDLLTHTVVVRRRVDPGRGRERPLIAINTRGDRRSDPEYQVYGSAVFKMSGKGDPKRVGDAELRSRGKRWIYLIDPAVIGDPKRYGWAAITSKGKAFDVAPASRYAVHRL